jgi:tetratricopeptide (TPR) repeat protein
VIKADLIELTKILTDNWHKRKGLLLASSLLSFFYWGFVILLYKVLKNEPTPGEAATGNTIYYTTLIAVYVFLLIALILFWRKSRTTPKMPKEKPSILFAIDANIEAKNEVQRLYNGFHKELKKRGLDSTIHYSILPKNQEIHNQDQARKYLGESGATIVIFGEYKSGFKKSKKTEQFQSLSFHWSGNTPIDEKDQAMIAVMEEFPFKVEESESLDQIPKAQSGFANVVLFFVALSLTSIGKTEEARSLWSDLIRKEQTIRKLGHRLSLYKKWWARNEYAYARYLYIRDVETNLTITEFHDTGKSILKILENTEKHLHDYPGYYMLKAICEFHTGESRLAKLTSEGGLKRFKKQPTLTCSFSLSLAFISAWRRLYNRSLRYYNSTIKISYSPDDSNQIIQFIRTVITNNPERKDLYFCISFITDHHCNAQDPRASYEDF